jgi:hypothetical protein
MNDGIRIGGSHRALKAFYREKEITAGSLGFASFGFTASFSGNFSIYI